MFLLIPLSLLKISNIDLFYENKTVDSFISYQPLRRVPFILLANNRSSSTCRMSVQVPSQLAKTMVDPEGAHWEFADHKITLFSSSSLTPKL